jgi:acyl-CoA thioesterase-2
VEHGRPVHSLHGYFLQAADTRQPIVYHVQRLRDGRSYSARYVVAMQNGRLVFTLSASFKTPERTPVRQPPMPPVTPPEELTDPYVLWARTRPNEFENAAYPQVVATRYAPRDERGQTQWGPQITTQSTWFKARHALPDDQVHHSCALTYMADLALAPTAASAHQPPRPLRKELPRVQLASLDFAVWFHGAFRADDWLLFRLRSPRSGDARGIVFGDVWTADGRYAASVAQEAAMRPSIPIVLPEETS